MKHSATRREGITLIEVLVAIFIMGVGLLAILVLFPVAALSMARAIRDDRAAQCGQQAGALANSFDLRHDTSVVSQLNAGPAVAGAFAAPLPDTPSYPVVIDPLGAQVGATSLGGNTNNPPTPGLRRIAPTVFPTSGAATVYDRWFTLLDDINFNPNGTPVGAVPERYGYYSWLYIARRPQHGRSLIDLTVVVYRGRSVAVTASERQVGPGQTVTIVGTPAAGVSTFRINVPANNEPDVRAGGYLLDTSYVATTVGGTPSGTVAGQVYQVVDIQKSPTAWQLRVEPPLRNSLTNFVFLEGAIAAFEKGTGWRP